MDTFRYDPNYFQPAGYSPYNGYPNGPHVIALNPDRSHPTVANVVTRAPGLTRAEFEEIRQSAVWRPEREEPTECLAFLSFCAVNCFWNCLRDICNVQRPGSDEHATR